MRKFAGLLLIGFLLTLLPARAIAPDWKLVARMKGKVEGQKAQTTDWFSIWQSRLMQDGDKARTGADSRAKIILADESWVVLGENTTVELQSFKLTPETRSVKLKLLLGKIRTAVGKFLGRDNNYEVITPNGVLSARGTEFYVEEKPEAQTAGESDLALGPVGNTFVIVFSGTVWAATGLGSFPIFPGQSALLTPSGEVIINPPSFLPPGIAGPNGEEQGTGVDADLLADTNVNTFDVPPGGNQLPTPPQQQVNPNNQNPQVSGIVNVLVNPGVGNLNINVGAGAGVLPININTGTGDVPVIVH